MGVRLSFPPFRYLHSALVFVFAFAWAVSLSSFTARAADLVLAMESVKHPSAAIMVAVYASEADYNSKPSELGRF